MKDLSRAETQILNMRLVLFGLFLVSAAIYFPWRLSVFNMDAPVFSAAFFALEVIGFVWGVVFLLSVLRLTPPDAPAAPQGLAVDVFIPTYNEPVEIVRRTLVAAIRISYPHETWLLDDGNRPAMRDLAAELGCHYLAREKNTDAKAGNLNNALAHAKGEFIASFDADFIADPRFLDRTLGYFTDPKVAFVQTPQEYYNYDSFQHTGRGRMADAWSEHSLFYRVIQPGRDMYNGAMFCGCSAVLRRAAIDSVGGIATGTVTEDMHTSVRLHNASWDSAYHSETLSAGLAPHDALSFRKQRLRWAQGAMQVFRKEKLLTGSRGLTPFQRLCYIMHVIAHMEGLRHTLIYLIPIVTLAFGLSPFRLTMPLGEWLMFSLPMVVLGIVCYEEYSRGHGRILLNEMYNLARCPSSIRAIPALVDARHIPFWVTPKMKSKSGFLFPWLILAATVAAIAKSVWDHWQGNATLTGWPLVIVCVWAFFSAAMSFSVIRLTRRCTLNRREFSRFPTEMPVMLQPAQGGAAVAATVTALSDRGLSVNAPGAAAGKYSLSLRLNGAQIPLEIDLRESNAGGHAGGQLLWENQAAEDSYQYAIIIDRIRWLSTHDDVRLKSMIGRFLPGVQADRALAHCDK